MADDVFTVNKICEYLEKKLLLDPMLSKVRVRGEVTNYSVSSKGQVYFNIKDSLSSLSCIAFNEKLIKDNIENGSMVVVTGEIGFYKRFGKINLVVKEVTLQGKGDLYEEFLLTKQRLQDQGLFDHEHKKALPKYPFKIGVITSSTGAAMHDIINVATRRFSGVKIDVYSCVVQGESAPRSLIAGLDYFEKADDIDVVIIGRGGGSFEDLSAFNDENLAQKVFDFSKPIVSAVGHEVDFTICDFVADVRAATPSVAAEVCVPVMEDILRQITDYTRNMAFSLKDKVTYMSLKVKKNIMVIRQNSPMERVIKLKSKFDMLTNNITHSMKNKHYKNVMLLLAQKQKLHSISPKNVLARGFSYIIDEQGKNIKSVSMINSDENFKVILNDGSLYAKVITKEDGKLQ